MFKSRRSAHLVLMQDDKERPSRRVSNLDKSPVVNETKPYAGEGGMKKLLARRKQEEKEEDKETESSTESKGQTVPESSKSIPPPPPSDWFSVASDHTSLPSGSGSSLRVGRAKSSRSHIQRPAKTRFSAVYEEEPEDNKDEDDSRSEERRILEEAAKKVPVFNIPAGFSFAKDVRYFSPPLFFWPNIHLLLFRHLPSNLSTLRRPKSPQFLHCPFHSPNLRRHLSRFQLP